MNSGKLLCSNLTIEGSSLYFAGQRVSSLAEKYGTPLYLIDADRVRERCRTYKSAAGENARIMYASKAASFKAMYRIMNEEDMYIDVVSCGEIATALAAGFPLERAYFHSCSKSDEDINYALDNGIGYFVVDNEEELFAIDGLCAKRGIKQNILLRLTPGIDPHTFAAVSTGNVDSKFGFGITTGMAEDMLRKSLSCGNIKLCGFHCHMGSQIFDESVFMDASDIMLSFVALAKQKYGYTAEQLDLGGGIAVRYLPSDPEPDISAIVSKLVKHVEKRCLEMDVKMPVIGFEPGRSIVADAGMTVYKAGSVKCIPGFKTYVSVDGGMTDNIRYAMYKSPYTVLAPEYMNDEQTMQCDLVGRCCESGDVIQPCVDLPERIKRGDYVAVLTTGAYNYSMASNYNRIPRPALVMLSEGDSFIGVRRESFEDVCSLDE